MEIIIILIILLFSAVIHEICHGVMALRMGDDTAKVEGRLTLNPIPHLDPFGSILLPIFLWYATHGAFTLGSAKPVPVDFLRMRDPKKGMILVSLAGPLSNFLLAIIFAIPLRLGLVPVESLGYVILLQGALINLSLGTFNLLPLPPLDGFKVFAALLSNNLVTIYRFLAYERYGFIIIIFLLYTGAIHSVLLPLMNFFARIILGFSIT